MTIRMFSSLRARLMLLVLAGSFPLVIVLIYSGLEMREHYAEDVQREAAHFSAMVSNKQQQLVTDTRRMLSVLARNRQIRNDDAFICNNYLAQLLANNSSYINLGVISLNGDLYCSGTPFQEPVNLADRAYFKRTLKSHDFAIGDYQIGRITHKPVLVFSYPVLNERKQLKSVLFAAVQLNWGEKLATDHPLHPASIIHVIDHSTHALLERYPASTARTASSMANTRLVEAIHAQGHTGKIELTDPDGVKRLHSFSQIQNLPNDKEVVVDFAIPTTLVYAKANQAMARNLAILILMIVLTILLAWYGNNVLVINPVTRILAATRRLASGDFSVQAMISDKNNEISQLGIEFNRMVVALKKRDSEARQAEDLLHHSEENLRHMVEAVPDIIYTAAADNFAATFVSPVLTRILGYTPEEFMTDPEKWAASIHDEDRESVFTQLQSALDNAGDGFHLEYRIWHKDRNIFRWFEDRGCINRDDAGHATDIFGVMSDITEQKQAAMLSLRLGRILQDSWNEIYIFDASTLRFSEVSNGACRNLGYSMDELKRLTVLDLKTDYTPEQFEAVVGPLRREEKSQLTFESRHKRKDGSDYPIEVRLQLSRIETPPVFIAIIQDISERQGYIAELEHKALYDKLTDLPNRCLFMDHLKHEIQLAQRGGSTLAVLTLDVLRMREVNDILGHDAGDLVLQELARRLQQTLRKSDTVGRLGGDVYAISLTQSSRELASVTASKIQKLFEQPVVIAGTSVEIESVIGIALYPEHGDEQSMLLQHADIAMQMAKNEARGFSIYNPETNPYSLRRLTLLGELRQAIEHKELALYYQPKIDLRLGRITSVEALARWPHPVEGMIPPGDFIPMVEQSGLIKPFTMWVLEQAVLQLKHWSEQGIDLGIAVNLSTRNLLDSGLSANISKLLKTHHVSPELLSLEVTESAVMSRPETALKILLQLHEMGHKLSIDDFGTGYSSLAYLKKLPVHELKIDQSFIFGLTSNDDDAVIVRSTINLAQNMGLKVVAEGVEDQDTMDLLTLLECDIAQGYHICRPICADEMAQWLLNSPWGIK